MPSDAATDRAEPLRPAPKWPPLRRIAVAAVVVSLLAVGVVHGAADAEAPLTDREAILELQARYFRTLDQKEWAAFRALLADDVHVDLSADQRGTFANADSFVAALQQDGVTVHQGHMPEIALGSTDAATGIWAIEDLDQQPDGSGGQLEVHGYGHYHVTYSRIAGEWKVSALTVTRLRVDAGA